jgi:hypothetical protein
MIRPALLAVLVLAGCNAAVGDLPQDVLAFGATALMQPAVPRPGQAVSVQLEVTSASNVTVLANVELLVEDGAGRQVGYREWTGVQFHPEEVWNLTDDFLPPTDTFAADWRVQLTMTDAATGATLLHLPELMKVAAKSK